MGDIEKLKAKCDKMYYDYIELQNQYKSLKGKYEGVYNDHIELLDQFEILKGKYDATFKSIKAKKKEFISSQKDISPVTSPKKSKIRIRTSPPKVVPISPQNKGRKASSETSGWTSFLERHGGEGHSMKELSKMYRSREF